MGLGEGARLRVSTRGAGGVRHLAALLALVALTGCDLLLPGGSPFPEHRVYAHALFESQAECDAWRESAGEMAGELNCSELARFCPDGTADLLLGGGDVVMRGTYSVSGSQVDVEIGNTAVRFWLRDGGRELIRTPMGSRWHLEDEEDTSFSPGSCPTG